MRTRDIVAALGGRVVDPATLVRADVCTACSGPARGYPDGRPVVCERCICRELGTTPYALALAVEFHLSIKVCEARLERFGPPSVSPKEWLTPRSRLR